MFIEIYNDLKDKFEKKQVYPTYDKTIVLMDRSNPLSAVDKFDLKPVVKFSYWPEKNKLVYSRPGEFHADGIARIKDIKNFDKYVRIIKDANRDVAGSRVFSEDKEESFEMQHIGYMFFKKYIPKIKWIFNLTNDNLQGRTELLDSKLVNSKFILNESQIEAIKIEFKIK